MDTVLCAGNTALVVSCPLSTGEFGTKMAPRLHRKHRSAEVDLRGGGLSLAAGGEDPQNVGGVPGPLEGTPQTRGMAALGG